MGDIYTFYSFKGGVGRTMALANMGFLAALNGKRVLLMDWDLEAPGLAYYFRGLLGEESLEQVMAAPGVLDVLCEWQTIVTEETDQTKLKAHGARFEQGEPFAACVRSLVDADLPLLPENACLDLIGPGSKQIHGKSFAATLANFSWDAFIGQHAGGFVLEQWRNWCKQHYDIVLIDSRTGLADSAGVCTMQMPDTVLLCFVLNQQNMDGIGTVAHSIAAVSERKIGLRLMPMRVSQRDSREGSEAQFLAKAVLQATGAIDNQLLLHDFMRFGVPLQDHLPYQETLAPLLVPEPGFDPLTLKYAQIAKEIFQINIELGQRNKDIFGLLRFRLVPRIATRNFLEELGYRPSPESIQIFMELLQNTREHVANGNVLPEGYLHDLFSCATKLAIGRRAQELSEEILALETCNILRKINVQISPLRQSNSAPKKLSKAGKDAKSKPVKTNA